AQFSEHIATNFPNIKGEKLLIAISGGVDSVVLAELLYKLDYTISLAHCNFQLRDVESNKDEAFIIEMSKRLKIPIYTKKFATEKFAKNQKTSTQLAARKLRYDWFSELLEEHNLDALLTGHHADDNLETFLINLSRGTGLDGLIGIPEKNGKILRLLLPFSRKQIEKYALDHNLSWREDASNAEIKYVRNKFRHDVIPTLKQINPQILDVFSTTISHLQDTKKIVLAAVKNARLSVIHSDENGILKLKISELKKLDCPKPFLYELVKKYNFTSWSDIYNLLDAQSGKYVLSNTHRILKDRDFLIVSIISEISKTEVYNFESFQSIIETESFQIKITASSEFNKVKNSNITFVDADKLKWPITIRKWQKGDSFYPFGMNGKKKLSKYFKDEKRSLIDKENTWILISDAKIVWIINSRLDERFKVTNTTKSIFKLEMI
ncbi:UNVERIFIED_CONTAM: hypothetical protein GTU68_004167, partial [Idotea baltica]|nr:hypothetical protein [Idotea baltica]